MKVLLINGSPHEKGCTYTALEEIAKAHSLSVLARLPIDPALARACDEGRVEQLERNYLEDVARAL